MTRPNVAVRAARPDDLPALAELWDELRDDGVRFSSVAPTSVGAGTADRLAEALRDPACRVVVAEDGARVVGMAVFWLQQLAPLQVQPCVHVGYLHVRGQHRRRGAGRALVSAAASFAEEVGAEHVVVSVLPQLRDANRFYARLGFGPVVVRRATSVAGLRRRLATEAPAGAVGDMLARRRAVRTRSRVRSAVRAAADQA